MIRTKVAFLEGGFYTANQSNLKSIQKALPLIAWKKAGPPKKPLLFPSCKQANFTQLLTNFILLNFFVI